MPSLSVGGALRLGLSLISGASLLINAYFVCTMLDVGGEPVRGKNGHPDEKESLLAQKRVLKQQLSSVRSERDKLVQTEKFLRKELATSNKELSALPRRYKDQLTAATETCEVLAIEVRSLREERKACDQLSAQATRLREKITQNRHKYCDGCEVQLPPAPICPVCPQCSCLQVEEQLGNRTVEAAQLSTRVAQLSGQIAPLEKKWGCGIQDSDSEQVLLNHPAMHDHLDGHEYFRKTMGVIEKFGQQRLTNHTFLEVGYGLGLASVIMRGFGTTIYAMEPYPVPWTPLRHGPFYDALLEDTRVAQARGELGEAFDVDKAADFARRCGQDPENVTILQTTLEVLAGIPDSIVDITYSNAVLEHISDPIASFKALARVTRKGGVSCHQIDMRDHRSFNRPWEFLVNDTDFEENLNHMEEEKRHPFFGNRIRLSEFIEAANINGWQTVHLERQHEPASEEGLRYVETTLARLRACTGCRYQNWTRTDLDECTSNHMPMTGVFWCTRYVGEPLNKTDEAPPCGKDNWNRSGTDVMF